MNIRLHMWKKKRKQKKLKADKVPNEVKRTLHKKANEENILFSDRHDNEQSKSLILFLLIKQR